MIIRNFVCTAVAELMFTVRIGIVSRIGEDGATQCRSKDNELKWKKKRNGKSNRLFINRNKLEPIEKEEKKTKRLGIRQFSIE